MSDSTQPASFPYARPPTLPAPTEGVSQKALAAPADTQVAAKPKTARDALKAFTKSVNDIHQRAVEGTGGRFVETLRLARLVHHRLSPEHKAQGLAFTRQVEGGFLGFYTPEQLRQHHALRMKVDKVIAETQAVLEDDANRESARAQADGDTSGLPVYEEGASIKV